MTLVNKTLNKKILIENCAFNASKIKVLKFFKE